MSSQPYLKFRLREIAILRSLSTQYVLSLCVREWEFSVRLVAKYFEQARRFDCIAEQEKNLRLKRGFKEQAEAYRKLAQARAKQLGISLPPPVTAKVQSAHAGRRQ